MTQAKQLSSRNFSIPLRLNRDAGGTLPSSLHTNNLPERMDNLHQVRLRRHHRVDRFIGRRRFVNHLGIFPPVKGDAALSKVLAKHRSEKGSLRFSFDEPMPYPLIRRVVQARLKEHLARRAAKRKKR